MPRSAERPTSRSTARPIERPRRAWDVPLTVGLLALGFVLTVQSIEGFLNFGSTVAQSVAQAGLDLEFGQEADAAGVILLFIHFARFSSPPSASPWL